MYELALTNYEVSPMFRSMIGREDVMLGPEHPEKDDAIILEFKVKNKRREETVR